MEQTIKFRGRTFQHVQTGGGCTAYEATDADGTYWLITNDDMEAPQIGEAGSLVKFVNEQASSEGEYLAVEKLDAFTADE